MEDFEDLKATLKWGAELQLTDAQRKALSGLCARICGRGFEETSIPSWRLKEEADKRRAAEKRVAELEAALKSRRDEFVFRRGKPQNSAILAR